MRFFTDGGSKDDHSPLWGWGHYKLESFGFWGRKFCIKNVEILSVGKIAEFAKFAGGKDGSLQTLLVYTSGASCWGVGPLRV